MSFTSKTILIITIVFIVAVAYFVIVPRIQNFENITIENDSSIDSISFGTTTLSVELAVTQDEKERGLGGRPFLDDDGGMLFVYQSSGYPAIWMKDMAFSIDIAWLDENFRIVDIEKNVSPNTYPTAFGPDLPARYVLETNAGFFDNHSIGIGDAMKYNNDQI